MDRLSSQGQMLSQINLDTVPHSSFDRRNHNFLSGKLGKIICTRLDEVYPGDRLVGPTEAVVNFEPLAGPIMGSMVLKQESFYVPTSLLWKDAHKFFTGKHDFSDPMPSVSPLEIVHAIFDDFSVIGQLDNLGHFLDHFGDPSSPAASAAELLDIFNNTRDFVEQFSNSYQVRDLFSWWIDFLDECLDGSEIVPNLYNSKKHQIIYDYSQLSVHDSSNPKVQAYCKLITDYYYMIFKYFFGVSSHLDYMGWPVFDNLEEMFYHRFRDDPSVGYYSFYDLLLDVNSSYRDWNFDNLFSAIPFNWMPMRAAYLIWYWNYRDELLEIKALDPEDDDFITDHITSTEIILLSLLRVRCWYKDTFTTALTNTGSANLTIPVGSPDGGDMNVRYYDAQGSLIETSDRAAAFQAGATYCEIGTGRLNYRIPLNYLTSSLEYFDPNSDLSGTQLYISLDLLDRVRRLRKFVQKRLILGYEYDDMVWSSFMVKLSNVRMRIPELLARGRDAVDINTIVNNTTTSEQIAGDKSAVAWAKGRTSDVNYFVEEHGYFISFATIMPIQTYTGGMQRLYLKREQFDFMWPEFATMGMDAVYNIELSAPRGAFAKSGLSDEDSLRVFGYQGRYYDLKSRLDEAHGRFRTDLNFMLFSREFNSEEPPKLNYIFVHCWPRLDMFVTEDPTEDVFKADFYHGFDYQRRLPVPSEIL